MGKLKNLLYSLPIAFAFIFSATTDLHSQQLFSSGPIITHPGAGAGGTDLSVLQDTALNLTIFGAGHQKQFTNRVADDFVVPACGWKIDSVVFFAYQTGSSTTSPITAVNFQIWDSLPDVSGSNVVYGDSLTNQLTKTKFSLIWRVTQTTMSNTQRPIMRNTCAISPSLSIGGGTYWIDWQSDGNQTLTGPWCPVVSIMGQATTGNGRQTTTPPGNWIAYVDDSTLTAQGFPFILYGSSSQVIADAGADTSVCPNTVMTIGGSPSGSGGLGALTYNWSPSTGLSSSTVANPTATLPGTILYTLVVSDSVGCSDTATIDISTGGISANLLGNDTTVCNPNYTLNAGAGFTSYNWSNAATSQSIAIGASGNYWVQVMNSAGCILSDTIALTFGVVPSANFNFSVGGGGLAYTFTDLSTGATTWSWDFGDGNNSSLQSPVHNYSASGSYVVTLIASSPCGSDTSTQSIVATGYAEVQSWFEIYPNPADDQITLRRSDGFSSPMFIRMITWDGRTVLAMSEAKKRMDLDVCELPAGLYFLEVVSGGRKATIKAAIR